MATDAQIDAAIAVLREYVDLGEYARVGDYLRDGMTAEERAQGIVDLKAADRRAESWTRTYVGQALDAAAEVK